MRMTDHVLNATALRSGVPINSVSLVSQLGRNSQGSLLEALEEGSAAGAGKKDSYEKLKKAAEQLAQSMDAFAKEGEDSIFAKAKATGDSQEIQKSLESLAKSYNETLKALKSTASPMDAYYRQMLQEAAKESGESLAGIGVSLGKDGTISIDKEKLAAAGIESLEEALGASAGFTSKVSFLAGRIFGNARANAESSSGRYDAAGNSYAAYSNMYDIWG